MAAPDLSRREAAPLPGGPDYPLKETAAMLNDRLGLYLSEDQQRGLATGLLIGTAIGAAIFAWNIAGALRRNG